MIKKRLLKYSYFCVSPKSQICLIACIKERLLLRVHAPAPRIHHKALQHRCLKLCLMLIGPASDGIAAVLPSLPFAKVQSSGHIGATENKELEREVNDEESEVPIFWRWRRKWRRSHVAAERQACRYSTT